jgi:hypothetical protein
MSLHKTTFDYLEPTLDQLASMKLLREAAKTYAATVEQLSPEGPDKTYALRKLREIAMWVNVTITRQADGSPRV